jgi:ribonuclease Z
MTFDVTILGCGAAAPTTKHNPTAQVVNMHDKLFLIDCGEGTQMQMRKYKIRFQRINHIFISHLHGDHYLGLLGFISSMHLLGRKTKLYIYGPADLKAIIDINLKASCTFLDYEIEFHATDVKNRQKIYEDKSLEVYSFPLKHRVDCCGFIFWEKQRKPKIEKELIERYKLRPSQIIQLKRGEDTLLDDGSVLPFSVACTPADAPKAYAYCSDTAYSETVIENVKGATLLYHESTFLNSERERAKATFHSTAEQAATVAHKAGAQRLLLGHFSARYTEEQDFVTEANTVFPNVELADEGLTFYI